MNYIHARRFKRSKLVFSGIKWLLRFTLLLPWIRRLEDFYRFTQFLSSWTLLPSYAKMPSLLPYPHTLWGPSRSPGPASGRSGSRFNGYVRRTTVTVRTFDTTRCAAWRAGPDRRAAARVVLVGSSCVGVDGVRFAHPTDFTRI